ncbi:hypothetical protein PR048_025658 [Dryococelus australis]|uniref:Uncharacterized protein n=1 Tax=Dryococelus australis TaxID=614101 RepID=A0ABQ9GJ50_9NEOP|nr:hypothetical protein PR048_025658 [Dryococelus australis]
MLGFTVLYTLETLSSAYWFLRSRLFRAHSHYSNLLITGSQLNTACTHNCCPITVAGGNNKRLKSTSPQKEFANILGTLVSGRVSTWEDYLTGSIVVKYFDTERPRFAYGYLMCETKAPESSAYWSFSCVFIGCFLTPGSYGIHKVFRCKSAIGSEDCSAGIINCEGDFTIKVSTDNPNNPKYTGFYFNSTDSPVSKQNSVDESDSGLQRRNDGGIALLASHALDSRRGGGGVAPRFSHVGIVPDDAAGRRVFSGMSHFPRPFVPVLHTRLAPPSSPYETSILRDTRISSLTHPISHVASDDGVLDTRGSVALMPPAPFGLKGGKQLQCAKYLRPEKYLSGARLESQPYVAPVSCPSVHQAVTRQCISRDLKSSSLVHALSPSTVIADYPCAVYIGIFVDKTVQSSPQVNELANFPGLYALVRQLKAIHNNPTSGNPSGRQNLASCILAELEPAANLQRKEDRIQCCPVWRKTGASFNEQAAQTRVHE